MEHRKYFALLLVLTTLIAVFMTRSEFRGTSVSDVSAVMAAQNLGVYWNENCTQATNSIDWGVLSPSQLREVVVYVKNEGNATFILVLTALNWNPENASRHLGFTWISEDRSLNAGQVVKVTLSLSVSPYTTGIDNFAFDIVFEGRDNYSGDLNRDGTINVLDIGILNAAYGSTPADSNWNPNADLNNDGAIDILDLYLIFLDFGQSSSGT